MSKPPTLYRPCVGLYLLNSDNHIFVGERIDRPGAWQMPQGGIDEGESIEQATMREMLEEIGTDKAKILHITQKTFKYDLPKRLIHQLWDGKYKGQEQTWVALRFTGQDSDINIHSQKYAPAEFGRWKWAEPCALLNLIVPFKRETYREVIEIFKDIVV